eukprot:1389660-Amorphochlora_amoeboformis.AAC.1
MENPPKPPHTQEHQQSSLKTFNRIDKGSGIGEGRVSLLIHNVLVQAPSHYEHVEYLRTMTYGQTVMCRFTGGRFGLYRPPGAR